MEFAFREEQSRKICVEPRGHDSTALQAETKRHGTRTGKSSHRKTHYIADLAIVTSEHDPDDRECDHADDEDRPEHENSISGPTVTELEADAAVHHREALAVLAKPCHPDELAGRDGGWVLHASCQFRTVVPSE